MTSRKIVRAKTGWERTSIREAESAKTQLWWSLSYYNDRVLEEEHFHDNHHIVIVVNVSDYFQSKSLLICHHLLSSCYWWSKQTKTNLTNCHAQVPLTGSSMNPARSLGPALITGQWVCHIKILKISQSFCVCKSISSIPFHIFENVSTYVRIATHLQRANHTNLTWHCTSSFHGIHSFSKVRGEISGSTGQVLKILTIFFILVVHVLKITPLLILISTIVIVNLPSPPNWRSRSWISLPEHLQGYPLKNWSQSLYIPNRNSIPEHSQGQAPLDLSLKAFWDGNEQWIKSPEICMFSDWSY